MADTNKEVKEIEEIYKNFLQKINKIEKERDQKISSILKRIDQRKIEAIRKKL
ncbi:MAG: hypothetical protein PHT51_01085 [Patescibacteria group bacterium]|nr:hypothetical protein [Patescibacteria group bacterium]MDD4611347.1 hypothetical protein [Patescibacteria group bacterium]